MHEHDHAPRESSGSPSHSASFRHRPRGAAFHGVGPCAGAKRAGPAHRRALRVRFPTCHVPGIVFGHRRRGRTGQEGPGGAVVATTALAPAAPAQREMGKAVVDSGGAARPRPRSATRARGAKTCEGAAMDRFRGCGFVRFGASMIVPAPNVIRDRGLRPCGCGESGIGSVFGTPAGCGAEGFTARLGRISPLA